jgi:hypothetical protein
VENRKTVESDRSVKLTTHLQLVQKLKMVHSPYDFSAWSFIKHRDNPEDEDLTTTVLFLSLLPLF